MSRTYYFDINGKQEPNNEAMLAFLLDEDVLFCGDIKYTDEPHPQTKTTIGLLLNINDIFVPAADSLEITLDELSIVFDWYQKYQYNGIVKWAALKTGLQPRAREKQRLIKVNLWTDELEKLEPNKW